MNQPSDRPNILLITTDQQHYQALGISNHVLATPNLDRLAAEGTVFDRAYCANPLCSPSRSSIITGQYPSTHGCWTIGTKLDESRPTLGSYLHEAGYATSLIGKAHFQPLASTPEQTSLEAPPTLRDLDFWAGFHGPYYGFDHIELARNHADEGWVGQHYALWMEENGLSTWRDHFRGPDNAGAGRRYAWDLPQEHHYTRFVADRSVAAIDRAADDDQPFFIWASFQDPHPPYLVPKPWASQYDAADIELPSRPDAAELAGASPWHRLTQQPDPDFGPWQETPYDNHGFRCHLIDPDTLRRDIATYYGMISFIDSSIGLVLSHLEERGLAENTMVIFTTDHGHFLGQHGLIAKGAFHYEDLIRIPMIIRYPGVVPMGHHTSALQSLVDFAPTFLTAAGASPRPDMQGVDQWSCWTGSGGPARDHVIVENRHQPTTVHIRTYVDDSYKLTVYRGMEFGELFNLTEDPDEHRNLFFDPDYQQLRLEVNERFLQAEISREASQYLRIAVA